MILGWRWYKFKNAIQETPQSIINLFIWLPVVWKDRDWDRHFLFSVMRFKLDRMEQVMRNATFVNAEKDADNIRESVLLLDRIIADSYVEQAMVLHDRKWGKSVMRCEPIDGAPGSRLHFDRENVITETDNKKEVKEYRRCAKHAMKMERQDLDALFGLMSKHIMGWWN